MPQRETEPNRHVINYLRYYCDGANKFDFAVLVSGPWGVGKTHLIKEFVKELKQRAEKAGRDFRPLFVSLYGMTSTQQIDDELFRQLHPVLSSKTMKIGWNILKGSLKAALKIDLDKEELTVDTALPDVDLTKVFKTPADALLIFDDLERCSMPVADVLGYINSFVEHNSFKAILLANEVELEKKEGEPLQQNGETSSGTTPYRLIKEKLIGQTLQVQPSATDALKTFLKDINFVRAKTFLSKKSEAVLNLHANSATNNLRLLKHALWDYERLARNLAPAHWSNDPAMEMLLKVSLVLAIEVRAGRLPRHAFPSLAISEIVRLMQAKKSGDTSIAEQIAHRYPAVSIEKSPLGLEHLERLLFEGWIAKNDVRQSLNASPYYASKSERPWLVAWRSWDISDTEFADVSNKIEEQFLRRQFQSNGEMLHIFGLRFYFSRIGTTGSTPTEIMKECMDCLDDVMKADQIEEANLSDMFTVGSLYCLGHQVISAETPEFQSIFSRYEQLVEQVKERRLPSHGKKLLEDMKADPLLFSRLLCANHVLPAVYWDVPILAAIPVKDFVKELLDLTPTAQGTIFAVLKERYGSGLLENKLKSEMHWLETLATEIEA